MNGIPGVETQTETAIIDHWKLGEEYLAEAYDHDQGNLLCGFAAGLRALGPAPSLMQIEYVAQFINADPGEARRDDLVWLLRELLLRLEEEA